MFVYVSMPVHMPMCTHSQATRQCLPVSLSFLAFHGVSNQKPARLLAISPALQSHGTGMKALLGVAHGCPGVKPRSSCRHLDPTLLIHQLLCGPLRLSKMRKLRGPFLPCIP